MPELHDSWASSDEPAILLAIYNVSGDRRGLARGTFACVREVIGFLPPTQSQLRALFELAERWALGVDASPSDDLRRARKLAAQEHALAPTLAPGPNAHAAMAVGLAVRLLDARDGALARTAGDAVERAATALRSAGVFPSTAEARTHLANVVRGALQGPGSPGPPFVARR
jgi:hypothetical protein